MTLSNLFKQIPSILLKQIQLIPRDIFAFLEMRKIKIHKNEFGIPLHNIKSLCS